MSSASQAAQLINHGAVQLPSVTIDSYNLELRSKDGFLGDRASRGAFFDKLEEIRVRLRKAGNDPFGKVPSKEIGKKQLDAMLVGEDKEAAVLVFGAVDAFSKELSFVIGKFLAEKEWEGTERIVVGGGLKESRIGELAMASAGLNLKAEGFAIELAPIRYHPDEAGLIGAAHLMPAWMLQGHDAILAVDIGGSNIRAGILITNLAVAPDLSKAKLWKSDLWRHAEDEPGRGQAVDRLVDMLKSLIAKAGKEKLNLAPVIGVSCPGIIERDGTIARGGQNLPGSNWESKRFNLPATLQAAIPTIGDHQTVVIMHNDAVVQGLSQVPFMQDVKRWGVLTIGTGLGNARYSNNESEDKSGSQKKNDGN